MTLIEIMIVSAVIGAMYFVVLGTGITNSELREDSMRLAGTLRTAFNMATTSGKQHRVVLDLKSQVYWIEMCAGSVKLRKEDEEEVLDKDKLEDREEQIKRAQEEMTRGLRPSSIGPGTSEVLPEIVGADNPEAAVDAAAALAGVRMGNAKCGPPTGAGGKTDPRAEPTQLGKKAQIRRVTVSRLAEPVDDALVRINFFPLGYSEKAAIEMVNPDGDQMTLLVHRMTGRVEFKRGDVDIDQFMHRNGAGDDEARDR